MRSTSTWCRSTMGPEATPEPVAGADTADFEYYPDYSPDDTLIAFNKLPQFATNPSREDSFDHVYYRADSEINVIPAEGGTPTRLASNDAACEGITGALYNSRAKWAPSHATDGGHGTQLLLLDLLDCAEFAVRHQPWFRKDEP